MNLNAEEIQFIVDELFHRQQARGRRDRKTSDGTAIDLRNIRSPIVVFCSKGDNITPPQQAMGWILDLYESVDEIRSYGQTIVYTIHETVGHLGIFVSGGVAKKEHGELSSNIDLIDTLPPGLYEAIFEAKTQAAINPDLVTGEWVMRCEARSLDDIRALGGNDAADERRFATAARVSELNLSLYRTFVQPMVRAMSNPSMAEWLRELHPLRLQYQLFSDANPMMRSVASLAEQVRKDRKPVSADNPLVAMQENASRQIVAALDRWRDTSEALAERTFLAAYGSPDRCRRRSASIRQEHACRGVRPRVGYTKSFFRRGSTKSSPGFWLVVFAKRSFVACSMQARRVQALMSGVSSWRGASAKLTTTCRSRTSRRWCASSSTSCCLIRKPRSRQFPHMLPPDVETRRKALPMSSGQIMKARGEIAEDKKRMDEITSLFGIDGQQKSAAPASFPAASKKPGKQKSSEGLNAAQEREGRGS